MRTAISRPDPVAVYYLATPLFAAADFLFGLPVRVAGLAVPWQRGVYYAVVLLLGILCRVRPGAVPWVGMAESSVNLFLLLLGILLPLWSLPEALLAGGPLQAGLGPLAAANALVAGTALVVSFHRNQRAALGRGGITKASKW